MTMTSGIQDVLFSLARNFWGFQSELLTRRITLLKFFHFFASGKKWNLLTPLSSSSSVLFQFFPVLYCSIICISRHLLSVRRHDNVVEAFRCSTFWVQELLMMMMMMMMMVVVVVVTVTVTATTTTTMMMVMMILVMLVIETCFNLKKKIIVTSWIGIWGVISIIIIELSINMSDCKIFNCEDSMIIFCREDYWQFYYNIINNKIILPNIF